MLGKFQTIDRDTAHLLPSSLWDWPPEKHLARFVVDMDELEMDIPRSWRAGGSAGGDRKPRWRLSGARSERFEAEQAEYEEKLRWREEKEAQTGKSARGRAPKPPQAGARETDQVRLTDEESRIMP